MKKLELKGRLDKTTVVALAIGLCIGFGAFSMVSASEKQDNKDASQGVEVHIEKGTSTTPQKRFNLDATINKMRQSAANLSLPSSMFEPWWQTMFHDPDSVWLLNNFDIMSSNPDKSWAFPLGTGAYIPRVDVDASGDRVKVTAEVPGMEHNDLAVTVTDDSISIKGEKRADQTDKNKDGYQTVERHYGAFQRMISLPCAVNSDKAEARLKNGVLTVTMPKSNTKVAEGKKLNIVQE